jgi:hypothetical protein
MTPKPAMPDDLDDLHDEPDYCDNCNNTGYVDCHCGGDLCVCENYGEFECPKCN